MKLAFLLSIALAVDRARRGVRRCGRCWTRWVSSTRSGRSVESVTRSNDTAQGVDILDYIGLNRVLSTTRSSPR